MADEEIWKVTESSGDEESEEAVEEKKENIKSDSLTSPDSKALAQARGEMNETLTSPKAKTSKYNPYERNKDYYESETNLNDELE